MPSSEILQAQALIPGAYEPSTSSHRQMGSMGGPAFGSSDIATGPSSLSASIARWRAAAGQSAAAAARRPTTGARANAG